MIKKYLIVLLKKDHRLEPDGYDTKTIDTIKMEADGWGWTKDTQEEAEKQIENLLTRKSYEYSEFSIMTIYVNDN